MLAKCSVLPRGRRAAQLASTEMLAQGPTRYSVHSDSERCHSWRVSRGPPALCFFAAGADLVRCNAHGS